ncbi:hypothetical protein AB0395_35145 [Streptosporangium sp. NPDC051023]|uniref:hypothetical protein n=1 Tax=Streptosporangium sp. NPDC051023 TaxID=3155410 RepID=UPI00344D7A58
MAPNDTPWAQALNDLYRQEGMTDPLTPDDILRRCRWALKHNEGHPSGAWSTGEQLAVAVVLEDHAHLDAMDYTVEQAYQRVLGGMVSAPADPVAWFESIRAELAR